METIAVSKFRSNLMHVLQKIEQGASVIITSHGKAVAKLVPPDEIDPALKERLNRIRKTAVIRDIVSPIDEQWDVLQ